MPPAAVRLASPANVQAGPGIAGAVMLRTRERTRLLVRGPVSGRAYEFSADRPAQAVDSRDAQVLLRTRHFVRA
jgi:hypothetical protein